MNRTETPTDPTQLRVLLVDDNAALRGALRVSLHAFGCARVHEADTVDRALDVLDSNPVDLVITDWKMAPRDGWTSSAPCAATATTALPSSRS